METVEALKQAGYEIVRSETTYDSKECILTISKDGATMRRFKTSKILPQESITELLSWLED